MVKPVRWHSLKTKKPEPFDLVTFRDAHGKEQPGWWTGSEIFFREQKIGKPIEYKTGPINIEATRREEIVMTGASVPRTGEKLDQQANRRKFKF